MAARNLWWSAYCGKSSSEFRYSTVEIFLRACLRRRSVSDSRVSAQQWLLEQAWLDPAPCHFSMVAMGKFFAIHSMASLVKGPVVLSVWKKMGTVSHEKATAARGPGTKGGGGGGCLGHGGGPIHWEETSLAGTTLGCQWSSVRP